MGSIPITCRHFKCPGSTRALQLKGWVCHTVAMRALIIVIGILLSPAASAEATTDQFLSEYRTASDDGRRYLDSFLKGLVAAYTWANITLKAEGQAPMFCLNEFGGKQIENPIQILREASNNRPGISTSPVGMALLATLKRRWPCREQSLVPDEQVNPLELVPPQDE